MSSPEFKSANSAPNAQEASTFQKVNYVVVGAVVAYCGYGGAEVSVDAIENGHTGIGVAGLMILGAIASSYVKTGFKIFHPQNFRVPE